MRKVLATVGIVLALGVAAQGGFAADEPFAKEIKARKAVMQIQAFNLSILGAMAKGKMPYDAKMAQNAADNLNATANMKNGERSSNARERRSWKPPSCCQCSVFFWQASWNLVTPIW